ncbi:glycoside hydrolase family 2 protein [Cellulomonas sp. PhB143]|uniref:glycoside hydrolase family 2 protein n=1 Tax=Cellulomonas sp. PhB143 TaxID=2485186 RepID=UPI000F4AC0BB|nr:glycoside hydrolase family 2 protein [Cellulomonas sp. PhB143]ROS79141.1 beta-mannosidase [Cellulomonas sp. PhB143]
MRDITEITTGWTLEPTRLAADAPAGFPTSPVTATVPGCVHTDLLDHALIPDPYFHKNEDGQHWIGRSAWTYRTSIDAVAEAGRTYELVFDGLDTVAHVELNGETLGDTANMHRTYRFDVTHLLRDGGNDLVVGFAPVREYTDAVVAEAGERPNVYPEPSQYVRKMACNFGWDWGPTLVTAGMWKSVRLESWQTARLAAVRPVARVDGSDGVLEVEIDVRADGGDERSLEVTVEVAGVVGTASVPAGGGTVRTQVTVPGVDVWWPRGYGEQPLYDVEVSLSADGAGLDTWTRRTGFRNVSLVTEPDDAGMSFVVTVNDTPVFVRGVNWIPDDCFVSRVGIDDYRERISRAAEANVNMLRIWGGGIYEKDELFDVCDELGVLVWQDFLFACSAYPETEELVAEVDAEARENVARLMPHPSLALWNGNNENIWGFFDWGWKEPLDGKDWGLGYYLDVLPRAVAETDPSRPYWAGSPYSGTMDRHPNDPAYGNHHSWEVWNREDYTAYADERPRFVSEFGYQAPPAWSTLAASVDDDPVLFDSPGVLHHQKAVDGNGKLASGMAAHLPEPVDTDDWHYLTQLNQAKAITFGVEHYRALWPHCAGAILWQLNDCWPVTSWAAIDGAGRLKPLWYAMRRLYADRILIQRTDDSGQRQVVVVNDGPTPWQGELSVVRHDVAGERLAEATIPVSVGARDSVSVPVPAVVATAGDPTRELVVAGLDGHRSVALFVEDRDAALEPARFDVDVEAVDGGVAVTVTARTLLRELVLNSDRIDPGSEVDDQLVTLLPGEKHVFRVSTTAAASDPRWSTAPVLRCLNDTVRAAVPVAV